MAVLQVEVVVGTIKVGWHHSDIVGAILKVVTLAHLKSRNLCDGILLIGVFQRRRQEYILAHWLRCILGVYAGAAQEEELLHTMRIGIADDVALHLHVLHDEIGTIKRICHDAAHEGCCQDHSVWLLLIEELLHCILICEVKLFVRTTHQVVIASSFEVVPNSRTHESVVSCYVYLTILV